MTDEHENPFENALPPESRIEVTMLTLERAYAKWSPQAVSNLRAGLPTPDFRKVLHEFVGEDDWPEKNWEAPSEVKLGIILENWRVWPKGEKPLIVVSSSQAHILQYFAFPNSRISPVYSDVPSIAQLIITREEEGEEGKYKIEELNVFIASGDFYFGQRGEVGISPGLEKLIRGAGKVVITNIFQLPEGDSDHLIESWNI